MKIQGLELTSQVVESLQSKAAEKKGGGESFSDALSNMLKKVSNLQKDAEQSVTDLVTGKDDDLHSVILAMNRADLAFRYMLEVRNRLVEAYQEVARTRV